MKHTAAARPARYKLGAGILLAAGLTALATLGLALLRDELNTSVVALLYLLPVGVSTSLGGLMVGVVAAILSFLAFNYFFIPPYYTLFVHQTQDLLVLSVFLVIAFALSQLLGRARAGQEAAQARERETTALYELSLALAGLNQVEAIARTVAERLREVSGAQQVALDFEPAQRPERLELHLPEGAAPAGEPQLRLPLATARGRLGELRLWREQPPFAPTEQRLLQTFAGLGALALEHGLLAAAETQAKILAESDRLKSALLSSVSHELRTPLATIKAAATSLRSGEVDWAGPARADLLTAVEEETDHLNRLVGNLLDMSRIEAGVLRPSRQWLSLAEVVGGTLARLRRNLDGYHLAVDVSDDLPLVPADHVQLDQVFTNLISNSLKHAPPASTISLTARDVEGRHLQVLVQNEGPPVPAADIGHIFDKFYQATAADGVTGAGLGLSICKGIVEAHGGRIWAENLAHGFAFNFTLPLAWKGARPPRLPPEVESA